MVSLAKSLAGSGITANAVSPAPVHTPALEHAYRTMAADRGWAEHLTWPELERRIVAEDWPNPSGRIAKPEDVAGAVAFLASPRAGFINKSFDLHCLEKIVDDPRALTELSIRDLVREAGTQGVELIMWLAARGALDGKVTKLHGHYHIPVSNTAAGLLLLSANGRPEVDRELPREIEHRALARL